MWAIDLLPPRLSHLSLDIIVNDGQALLRRHLAHRELQSALPEVGLMLSLVALEVSLSG